MTQAKINSFTQLKAWQESHRLVLSTYRVANHFPAKEQFGLTSQMTRAAVSVTSNIAEGFSRQTYRDKVHFYSIAHGSLTELQNQLIIARDISYIKVEQFRQLADQAVMAHKLISGLIKSSKSKFP